MAVTTVRAPGPAPQDFRDGAATGAAIIAYRVKMLAIWGVPLTVAVIEDLTEGVRSEYGGHIETSAVNFPGAADV